MFQHEKTDLALLLDCLKSESKEIEISRRRHKDQWPIFEFFSGILDPLKVAFFS